MASVKPTPTTTLLSVTFRKPSVFRRALATCKKCGLVWTTVPSCAKRINITESIAQTYEAEERQRPGETDDERIEREDRRRERLAAAKLLRSVPNLWLHDFACCDSNIQIAEVEGKLLTESETTAEMLKRGMR